jgi:hypothetical protein
VYKQMATNKNNLEEIAKQPSDDMNMIMQKMDKELNRVKSEAFGKVKEQKNNGGCKELDKLRRRRLSCSVQTILIIMTKI